MKAWLLALALLYSVTADGAVRNKPPVISGTPPTTATVGTLYSFTPSASDPEGKPLTFTISNKPAWASFSSITGTLSGTPTVASVSASITIRASDGAKRASLPTFIITTTDPTLPPPPLPTLTFTAQPTAILSGQSSTLTWSSKDASTCVASGAWAGSKNLSGNTSTGILVANVTFTLTCTGVGGQVIRSASVTVSEPPPPPPAPTLTLSAQPTAILSGESSTLTWSSTNTTSCTASGGWTGLKALSGSVSTGVLVADASFVLTCSGDGGQITQGTSVTVTTPPPPPVLGTAQVSWVAPQLNTDGTPLVDLASFRVLYGLTSGAWDSSVSTGSGLITSVLIEDLPAGTSYFAVKAVNQAGVESVPSQEVWKTIQ